MRKVFFVAGFLVLSVAAFTQAPSPSIQLADSIIHTDPEWVDVDNDGLLDVFLLMQSNSGKSYIGIIRGDTLNPLSKIVKVLPVISHDAYLITDYNNDNTIDVMVSGIRNNVPATVIYLNKGDFEFEEQTIATIPSFKKARIADLDDDAESELIVSGAGSGKPFLKILKQTSDFVWSPYDSLNLNCTAIEILDQDGDGDKDLFVSGIRSPNSFISGFLINNGGLHFTPLDTISLAGKTSTGDFNGDGLFDIILMGEDVSGQWQTKKYVSGQTGYTIENGSTVLQNGIPFVADLNYDGIVDFSYQGTTTSGDTVNTIQYSNGEADLLPRRQLLAHRFGDFDHNGNLDLLVLTRNNVITISLERILRERKNEGPKIPTQAVAIQVFNRVFIYWDKPADDHTAMASLTFDLHLSGTSAHEAAEFDLLNEKRLTVTHGNNGTKNFRLLKDTSLSGLQFAIQAIDNSFHSGRPCIGNGQACAAVAAEEISACSKERVVLESPPGALWFSFSKGFLGFGEGFDFSSNVSDTLFYYNPQKAGCDGLKAWAIKINDDTIKIEKGERYACLGESLELNAGSGWKDITWSSQVNGVLGMSESIMYTVAQPDSVFVTMSNPEGCKIIRKTAIKISKPELTLAADHYKIMKGGEVPLEASGAERYSWSPATGLNNTEIPNPVSTPPSSLQYTVTGFDSLNCTSQATVTISVEQTGFVPNLFSPNDDGQNDQLKIYGVNAAERFTFSIYDREGALVYKTSNVMEAVQQGWDGTKNGTKQPPGVYFWKVKGEIPSGQLLLNGKDSGSIVLIR